MLYYEDITLNNIRRSTDTHEVTAEAIKTFASEFDPMPFHLDEDVARQTPMGRLFASSIHTIAIAVKLTRGLSDEKMAVIAGLGWQDVKLPHPVFAGDELHIESEFIEKRLSRSKPEHGIITTQIRVFNQDNVLTAQLNLSSLVLQKPDS
ncbi:Uncharacterised protein [BD1-7 clade bacterium]|uniref:MaoC-like domain-containing protein n=1 Tax=BD1-7 clade bacterium TaxID=2029982 RepID=A0A5S9Q9Y7_9GAMM|nr:Uncharacterised protein [BD1-7 clade bacterium]CAA0114326.1 Uncharacterised protein [BD1-7 clade bacterium]